MVAGDRLGPYEILRPIGAGGMGEVYRATDTRLGRDVALKILPESVAGDADRLMRFEREARTLASLNHPNIAQVHGLEDDSGVRALVMELVEGEDLSERLARGPVPLDEALPIARQVAEALETAHELGIVHRDLKPANIKLRADGAVKVLDFGLAKAMEPPAGAGGQPPASGPASSPTFTSPALTQMGVVLGTAAYMSPEQARGRAVDKRSDIWAFGVVVFEMLSGKPLFAAETVSDTLAGVLRQDVDWSGLPATTPAAVREVLRRCLQREPKQRLRDIGDARLLLEDAAPAPATPPTGAAAARAPRWREGLAWALATAGLATAVALGWTLLAPAPEAPLTYFSIAMPADETLAFIDVPALALSPDGRTLAFTVSTRSGQTMIEVRPFDQTEARPVPGTENGTAPFFSPDGTSLGFFADGHVKTVKLAGGTVVTVTDAPTPRGAVWEPDGTILFSPEYAGGLLRVPAAGGPATPVVSPDMEKGERTFRWPDLLPDGRGVIFTVGTLDSPNDYDGARIVAYSFATGERHVLVNGASMARFLPPDRLVYSRGGVLFVVPLDTARLEVTGQPTPVFEGVAGDTSSGASHFALAPDGTLAAVRGTGSASRRLLTIVDRKGVATPLPLPARGYRHPTFSPDGTRLAFMIDDAASGVGTAADVWVYSFSGGSLSRLTFDRRSYPVWSPDGSRIAYLDPAQTRVLAKAADGSGSEEVLMAPQQKPLVPSDWSPDGRQLALSGVGPLNEILLLTPGGTPQQFEAGATLPAYSPDGRWIAYTRGIGDAYVFVRPVSGPGKWQVSPEIGSYPRWSRDGHELFYIGTGVGQRPLMMVKVSGGDTFRAGAPQQAIPDLSRYMTATAPMLDWDVSPAGDRFVFLEVERAASEGTSVEIALSWGRHVAAAAPTGANPTR